MDLINLTPHAIVVRGDRGDVTFPPSGQIARVGMAERAIPGMTVAGVAVIRRESGSVTGLPRDEAGHVVPCLVSSMVLDACPADLAGVVFAPDTGASAIRNDAGHVVAVTRLVTK